MSSLVVVAIPADDDQVWKVSSEKVPHLTLLYLGDADNASNVDDIAEFLQHAASISLNRFGLDVDRRGTLGQDEADVLFFDKGWDGKELSRFRHFLLQNDNISKAYNSVEQFDEWQPHLTLGYPSSPAKPNPDDYGISWVRFDRVALWVGDYEGPEFTLKTNSPEVSMSDTVDDILAHYGVKGMKWGVRNKKDQVRKDRGHEGQKVSTKKLAKLDKKFEKKTASTSTYVKIHNASAQHFNDNIDKVNKKYADKDLGFDPFTNEYKNATGKAYIKDAQKLADVSIKKALDEYGMNPSGTKRLVGKSDALTGNVQYMFEDVKHAEQILEFTLVTSSDGVITELKPASTAHAAIDDVLAHYGTKGMKWGVRKADKFFGTKTIPAKPNSSDAKKADQALAKAKSKGTKALSNDELKLLNERLQLEKRFKELNPTTTNKGKKILQQQLRQVGGMAVGAAASKYLIKRIV